MHPFLNTRIALRGHILRPVMAGPGTTGLGDCTGCAGLEDPHMCSGLPCSPGATEGLGHPVVWVPAPPRPSGASILAELGKMVSDHPDTQHQY